MIRRNIKYKNKEGMMILYKTLVRPTLDYCVPVWRPYNKKDIAKIERVQKRYTKMIEGCEGLSYEQRLSKLGITSMVDRHERADMIQVFKILNGDGRVFPELFLERSERSSRKNSMKLYKKKV